MQLALESVIKQSAPTTKQAENKEKLAAAVNSQAIPEPSGDPAMMVDRTTENLIDG